MSKWTPGPWTVDGPPDNQIVWSGTDERVCFLAHSNGRDEERDIATGRLIAAAPCLAEALEEWLAADDEWYESLNCDAGGAERRLDKAKDAARSALRRAKGEA